MNDAPHTATSESASTLAAELKAEAGGLGFDLVGIAPAVTPTGYHDFLDWLERGYAGEMSYLPRRQEAYSHPRHVLETVRSVVMLGVNYFSGDPDEEANVPVRGRVARYARPAADYHDVLRGRLRQLADWLHDRVPGCRTRGIVDTAPLLERDFARLAGLGWFGKNTMLINKRIGSWTFLAGLLTDVELESDEPHAASHCGTCTRCLEACPTDAFPEPHVLDASRCISYLTIELRDAMPPTELRPGIGDWLFGCDVCQDVCPWNRKAPKTCEDDFAPSGDTFGQVGAVEWLGLDEATFRERFRGTPMFRTGRAAILRNACLVLGNSGDATVIPHLQRALDDESPLVRAAAAWALRSWIRQDVVTAALRERGVVETNDVVRREIEETLRTAE